MASVTGQSCGRCFYGVVYPEGVRRCCKSAPTGDDRAYAFRKVEDWEWCGDFVAVQPSAPGLPVIISLAPTTAVHGVVNLTVNGQNFTADAAVLFDTIPAATTVVSSVLITAVVSIGRGTRTVFVQTAAGQSNGVQFIVT